MENHVSFRISFNIDGLFRLGYTSSGLELSGFGVDGLLDMDILLIGSGSFSWIVSKFALTLGWDSFSKNWTNCKAKLPLAGSLEAPPDPKENQPDCDLSPIFSHSWSFKVKTVDINFRIWVLLAGFGAQKYPTNKFFSNRVSTDVSFLLFWSSSLFCCWSIFCL